VDLAAGTKKIHLAQLIIEANKTGHSVGISTFSNSSIPIVVSLLVDNATNEIEGCKGSCAGGGAA
jgi:hypothetical protein